MKYYIKALALLIFKEFKRMFKRVLNKVLTAFKSILKELVYLILLIFFSTILVLLIPVAICLKLLDFIKIFHINILKEVKEIKKCSD